MCSSVICSVPPVATDMHVSPSSHLSVNQPSMSPSGHRFLAAIRALILLHRLANFYSKRWCATASSENEHMSAATRSSLVFMQLSIHLLKSPSNPFSMSHRIHLSTFHSSLLSAPSSNHSHLHISSNVVITVSLSSNPPMSSIPIPHPSISHSRRPLYVSQWWPRSVPISDAESGLSVLTSVRDRRFFQRHIKAPTAGNCRRKRMHALFVAHSPSLNRAPKASRCLLASLFGTRTDAPTRIAPQKSELTTANLRRDTAVAAVIYSRERFQVTRLPSVKSRIAEVRRCISG